MRENKGGGGGWNQGAMNKMGLGKKIKMPWTGLLVSAELLYHTTAY